MQTATIRDRRWCPGYGEGGHLAPGHFFYKGSRRCKECESLYAKLRRELARKRAQGVINPIILTDSAYYLTQKLPLATSNEG